MFYFLVVSTVLIVSGSGQEGFDFPLCSTNFYEIAGKCYKFVQNAATWSEAQSICEEVGADLASVKTDQEYTDLLQHINENYGGRYWISGSLTGGDWVWKDGSPMKQDWFGRAPSTSGDYCAYFCSFTMRYWDGECTLEKKFICQKEKDNARIDPRIGVESEVSTDL